MVYFVKDKRGIIKIGFTMKPIESRMRALQKEYSHVGPLSLLGVIPGNRKTELELHKKFDDENVSYEWFQGSDRLHNFIADNCVSIQDAEENSEPTMVFTAEAESKLKEIGELIKVARCRRGFSASSFAKRMGIDRRSLTSLENGSPAVSLGTFFQAISFLGLLRGLEEVFCPENDVEAIAINVYKIRRNMRKRNIDEDKVNF